MAGPLLIPLVLPLFALRCSKSDPTYSRLLVLAGAIGFAWMIAQGFSIGIRGYNFEWMNAAFGPLDDRQFGMGYGAMLCASAYLFLLTQGIAARGAVNGDVFVVSAIGGVIAIVTAFVFFPIAKMLFAAFVTDDGAYSILVFSTSSSTTGFGASAAWPVRVAELHGTPFSLPFWLD